MNIIKTLPRLPKRPRDSHKGDYGRVLIIAGSRGMSGAARLAAEGAMRSGAGLVMVATPKSQQPIVARKTTCPMTYPLPETKEGTLSLKALPHILNLAKKNDVIAIGPGLSQNPQTVKLVLAFLSSFTQAKACDYPKRNVVAPFRVRGIVIDADGLNALSKNVNILKKVKAPRSATLSLDTEGLGTSGRGTIGSPPITSGAPVILTPHPGEMEKLAGLKVERFKSSRVKIAMGFAKQYNVIVALKGHQTVVTDGKKVYINNTGNPGMATGGSGDVLTGIIAGLLGQKLSPFEAAQLGVYIHGLAGDLAAKDKGEISLIATDILEYLPAAFRLLKS